MRILFGSDFHGLSQAYERFSELLMTRNYELGIISGDLCSFSHDPQEHQRYLKQILWKAEKPVFILMGNDDGLLNQDWPSENNVHNINLKKVTFKGYTFIGYCYTNMHIGNHFKRSEQEQERDFRRMEKHLNENVILVTHGPPYGILDRTAVGIRIGSHALASSMTRCTVAYHLFGHVHSSYGFSRNSVNGAYPKSHKFFSIDLKKDEIKTVC